MSQLPVADLISKLLATAGIDQTDEIKTLLASKPFSEAQLPDVVASKLSGGLLSVSAAQEHPEVRKNLKGLFFGTHENKMKNFFQDKLGWSSEDWTEFKNATPGSSVSERINELFEKAMESGKRSAEKNSSGDVEELRKKLTIEIGEKFQAKQETNAKTIEQLQAEIEKQSVSFKNLSAESESKVASLQRDYYLESIISALPIKQDLISNPTMKTITLQALKQKLNDKADLVNENGTWTLKQKADNTAKYLHDNSPIQPDELLTILAEDILDKSGTKKTETPLPPGGNGSPNGAAKPMAESGAFKGPVQMF